MQLRWKRAPTTRPLSQQAFKKAATRNGKDRAGGEVELTCSYFLRIKDKDINTAQKLFKEKLPTDDMKKYYFVREILIIGLLI